MKIITISSKGQVTIPKSMRDKIQAKEYIFELKGENIILKPIKIQKTYTEKIPKEITALISTSMEFWKSEKDNKYKAFYNGYTDCKAIEYGSIVLIPYPILKKETNNVRPVLIIKTSQSRSLTVLPITSEKGNEIIKITCADLEEGLIPDSYIRYQLLFTIDKECIKKSIGKIKEEKLKTILEICKSTFEK